MPTYLYECEECGRFEEFQRITASPLEECPDCGSKVKRIIGQPGIIFKGSGFYITDNRDEGKNDSRKKSAQTGSKKTDKTEDEEKAS